MLNICIEHYTVALLNPVPLFLYHDTDAAVQSNQHLLPLAVLVDMPLAGFIGVSESNNPIIQLMKWQLCI